MGIVNRTLDVTEQKKNIYWSATTGAGTSGPLVTGVTNIVAIVPWPSIFYGGQMAAYGLSGAPSYALALNRFIAGTGFTTWILATGTSNLAAAYGTSGAGSFGTSLFGSSGIVCIASSSTLAIMQANDVITLTTGGTNASAISLAINLVIAPTADIKYSYGTGI